MDINHYTKVTKYKGVINMKKQYKNFSEQVSDNVASLELFDGELEFWWERLFETIFSNLDDHDVENIKEWYEVEDESSEEYYEAEIEYVHDQMQSVYLVYKVELKGGKYTSEHERLEITWDDESESWLMPVYCFGIAWSMVGVSN